VTAKNIVRVLRAAAILGVGVPYGTDAFFMLVGRRALERSAPSSLVDVMGHMHETADRRMPLVGVLGMVATAAMAVAAGPGPARRLGGTALAAQAGFVALYAARSAPINRQLTAGAVQGEVLPDARALQQRWDSVLPARLALLTVALGLLAACGGEG